MTTLDPDRLQMPQLPPRSSRLLPVPFDHQPLWVGSLRTWVSARVMTGTKKLASMDVVVGAPVLILDHHVPHSPLLPHQDQGRHQGRHLKDGDTESPTSTRTLKYRTEHQARKATHPRSPMILLSHPNLDLARHRYR